jgi:pimeloyl-ACP methyl ester carboxylesterase
LVDALQLEKAILVGHSLGCRVALQAAADRPSALSGIVLIEGSRLFPGPLSLAWRLTSALGKRQSPVMQAEEAFDSMFFDDSIQQERDRILRSFRETPASGIRRIAKAVAQWDALQLTNVLRRFPRDLPALAIQSTYHDHATIRHPLSSEATSTPWLDMLGRYIPSLQQSLIPGRGHFVMIEAAEEVATSIRRFAGPERRTSGRDSKSGGGLAGHRRT